MPSYEMTVLFRMLPKEELFTAVRRTASSILSEGGILRKLEGLGLNTQMPFRISVHGKPNRYANYFLYTFDSPTPVVTSLKDKYSFDVDIIRAAVFAIKPEQSQECTLEEELQPAPYRKPVQDLVAQTNKKKRVKFPLHTGFNYNPLA